MNLRFLGDVLDHWKGSIIGDLRTAKLIDNFMADQMATDFSQWGDIDRMLYARLLRIDPSMIIKHQGSVLSNRKRYLEEILMVKGDLFLDPDIGICTGRQSGAEHLKPAELHAILDRSPKRVVMVYQHVRAQKTRERVVEIMYHLQQKGPRFCAYTYECATVAMLFFSREMERVKKIGHFYEQMLDWHAGDRIYWWESPRPALKLLMRR